MFTKPEPCASASRAAGTQRTSHAVELDRRLLAVEEHEPVLLQPVGDARLVDERRLEHDDEVRVGDRVVAADRPVGDAGERAQRRAAPLRAVLRKRLNALAVPQQRQRQDLGGRLGALAGARVPADLGQLASSQPLVERARPRASLSATASTTLAPPLTASPAAKIFGFGVRPVLVDGLEQRAELVARPLADRLHDRVDGDDELAAGDRLGPAAAALVGIAESHLCAADALDAVVADDRHGARQEADLDALVAGELDLVLVGRHLVLGPPVEQQRDVGAESLRLDRDVDGGVAAADDGDALSRRAAARRSSAAR